MANVEIYSKSWCGYGAQAKALLDAKGVTYTDVDVTTDREKELEMIQRSGAHTVPQIFIDGEHIGGHDDLFALEAKGDLDRLLRNWKKYDFKVMHNGIDLERREEEHQDRWPSGRIKQVGRSTTEEAAREWEETKQKTITPRRK